MGEDDVVHKYDRLLADAGLRADLRVADIRTWEPDGRWDVVAPMWTFFHFVDNAPDVLSRCRGRRREGHRGSEPTRASRCLRGEGDA